MTESLVLPNGAPAVTPKPKGITVEQWANYAERVDLMSTTVATILQMLASNPMIAPVVGPQFVEEATNVANRLVYLRDNVS